MSSIKELTGGTGDVNPQLLNVSIRQSANDITTQIEQPIPFPRTSSRKGRSIVMEVLWAEFTIDDVGSGAATQITATLSTSTAAITITDPRTFAFYDRDLLFGTAIGFQSINRNKRFKLNDGAGHGFLVATDSVFLTILSTGTARQNLVNLKLFYRLKEVSLEEYLGIVSSQQ